ncbi:MAG: DinB family protein [Pyrinomonadaceae bacterium]
MAIAEKLIACKIKISSTPQIKISKHDWLKFLSNLEDKDLDRQIHFAPMPDEPEGVNRLRDVVLQLNYHSILHRAQICLRLHDQKIEPPHVDYIYYVQEK